MEVRRFLRTVRLKAFFWDSPCRTPESDSGLRVASTFIPQENQVPKEILTFEKCILKDIHLLKGKETRHLSKHNLSKDEYRALNELSQNKEIVIKPADKGDGIVVMTNAQYLAMVNLLLQDTDNYKKLKKDPTNEIKLEIEQVVRYGFDRKWISNNESEFLTTSQGRSPTIYALPKIHKNSEHPPGRHIVSGCGSTLEPICKFIDTFLKPMSVRTCTYLRDTTNTIQVFENVAFDTILSVTTGQ